MNTYVRAGLCPSAGGGRLIMTIAEVQQHLGAKILCEGDNPDEIFKSACGSDMMSDVLAFVKDQSILLTGLVNPQVMRTAEMMDIRCIVFVRGKEPDENMLALAGRQGMTVMNTPLRMYTACGRLYQAGLKGEDG